jgi:phosphate starvation-inducible PhoH-like protein
MAKRAALLVTNDYGDTVVRTPRKKAANQPKSTTTPQQQAVRNLSMKKVSPLNEAQRQMMEAFFAGSHIVAEGSAGTGKSYVGMHLALGELLENTVTSVKIVRSAVPTRDVGFLPGSLEEKSAIYELPYKDIVNDLLQCGTAYETLSKKGSIEFMTTSYLRGLTFRNCVMVIDEFQNMSKAEVFTILTRVGENCRIILCGDTRQKDLSPTQSGFDYLTALAKKLPKYIDVVHFTSRDIVRSEFVKAIIMAEEE